MLATIKTNRTIEQWIHLAAWGLGITLLSHPFMAGADTQVRLVSEDSNASISEGYSAPLESVLNQTQSFRAAFDSADRRHKWATQTRRMG